MKHIDMVLMFVLISIGIVTRTIFHIGPNVEFVTACSLTAGWFLQEKKFSWVVPFGIMVITDFLIGNSIIFIFTWSAFLCAPLFSRYINARHLYISATDAGICFTLFFFLWTNFGVVVTSNMYPKTIQGLGLSYVNGLPFLFNQLIGNMVIVPALFFVVSFMEKQQLLTINLEKKV